MELKEFIRDVPDFPKPGIIFKDITPLLSHAQAFTHAINQMAAPFRKQNIDKVVGIESRGFIFAGALARQFSAGFVPARKLKKLPWETIQAKYELEYGTDAIEMHQDAIEPGQTVLLVDDLLATGGTMRACCELVEKLGGQIAGISFLIELSALKGRKLLGKLPIHAVLQC